MAQITIKGLDVVKDIENQAKDIVNEELEDHFTRMANFAINQSPIWSGAYVKSFSFKAGNSSSRGRSTIVSLGYDYTSTVVVYACNQSKRPVL